MLPEFQTIMLPLLENLKDGNEISIPQIHDALASYFELPDEELNEHLSGKEQTVFAQRINEALLHLRRADLLSTTTPDHFIITPLGKQVLRRRLNTIDTNYLKRFPGYPEG